MNRYTRREASSLLRAGDDDDEEKLYERQALIDDDEICNNADITNNPFGIRQRQNINRTKSSDNNAYGQELKSLNKNRDFINDSNIEYTLYDIKPEDSLQSICLKYACPLNQVKRLNGLMTDQEFYGLRRIKLPLGKLGLLEDMLKSQQNNVNIFDNPISEFTPSPTPPPPPQQIPRTTINSPGSALSVSVRHNPQFKPLLSPGISSDRISDFSKQNLNGNQSITTNGSLKYHNHSHSFSSLRDFVSNDTNIDIEVQNQVYVASRHIEQPKAFIKSDFDNHYDENVETDDILMIGNDNVGKVFEDLDYHVERAKAVAETYDQRAAEIVDRIDTNNPNSMITNIRHKRSRIPDLFYCNENFGLSYKKLVIFIFIVCLVIPLIYLNQATTHSTN